MTLENTQYASAIAKVGGYYNFVTLINRRLKELGETKALSDDLAKKLEEATDAFRTSFLA